MKKVFRDLFVLLSIFMLIFPSLVMANKLEIDLKLKPGKIHTITLTDGKMNKVEFINAVPKLATKYEFFYEKMPVDPEVAPFPDSILKSQMEAKKRTSIVTTIEKINKLVDDPNNTKDWPEKKVGDLLDVLKEAIKKSNDDEEKATAKIYIENSMLSYEIDEVLKKGEKIKVTIKRDRTDDSTKKREWIFILTYPSEKWITTYGFCFVSQGLKKHDLYHVKDDETGTGITYNLIADEKQNLFDTEVIPTVFFSWPLLKKKESFNFCFTGGLGFDMTNPIAFVGCSGIVGYNIGITLGVVMHKQFKLKPKYSSETDPMTVQSHLEFDELHKGVYRPSLCLGISYRFGSNPFQAAVLASKEEKKEEKEEK